MTYKNKGSVAIEFIIIFPIFIMMFFAIFQFGWLFYMRYQIVNVAFTAIHLAATNTNASNSSVQTFTEQQLHRIGINTAIIEIEPEDITEAEQGDVLRMKVQVPARDLVPIDFPVQFGQVKIFVESTVVKEY